MTESSVEPRVLLRDIGQALFAGGRGFHLSLYDARSRLLC